MLPLELTGSPQDISRVELLGEFSCCRFSISLDSACDEVETRLRIIACYVHGRAIGIA